MKMNKLAFSAQKVIHNYKNFGLNYGNSYLLSKTLFRRDQSKTRKKALAILERDFAPLLEKFSEEKETPAPLSENEKNIFTLWWDGLDRAPNFVKECNRSLHHFYPDYHIFVLDKENLNQFVSLDERIMFLFSKGLITIQTFSDIVRAYVITAFGGFWCDATLMFFQREPLIERTLSTGFYSLNCDSLEKDHLWGKVNDNTWAGFFLGGRKNNQITSSLYKLFEEYYKKYDMVIDYFLIDYFLILIEKFGIGGNALSLIPKHPGNIFYLSHALEEQTTISLSDCCLCPQKLDWRRIGFSTSISKLMDGLDIQ